MFAVVGYHAVVCDAFIVYLIFSFGNGLLSQLDIIGVIMCQ